MVLTEQGMIPISSAVNRDVAALGLASVSAPIEPDWNADARARRALPWEVAKWPVRGKAIVTCPVTGDASTTPPWCYVVNLETGAWCKYTGWNTRCLVHHDEFVYFGTNDGAVMQAEITGADDGALYYSNCVLGFDHLGAAGAYKTIAEMRAQFVTKGDFAPQLSVSTDYAITLPSPPNAAIFADSPGEWDVGLWDVAKWDVGVEPYAQSTRWVSVTGAGLVHAAQVQVTNGSETTPSAELVVIDLKVEYGDDTS